jgi:hypothetical protein
MIDILERRFGLIMFMWVMCLIAISLGVKVGAYGIGAADHPIAPFVSFLMGMTWYLTLLTAVLGVSKKYWLQHLASLFGQERTKAT